MHAVGCYRLMMSRTLLADASKLLCQARWYSSSARNIHLRPPLVSGLTRQSCILRADSLSVHIQRKSRWSSFVRNLMSHAYANLTSSQLNALVLETSLQQDTMLKCPFPSSPVARVLRDWFGIASFSLYPAAVFLLATARSYVTADHGADSALRLFLSILQSIFYSP
ncbi:hypothetical protein OBBRIDRAFT_285148 [Obba rivulosa]|uniref:Uncharacterized protein n=1 Tax=Obba rivulosa TaxID=1052685 RepID=A0A8E2ALZ1_9APHY|nr:hypothetical protein OBBRIDRAFT_285148 [Obba rivulosa]